MKELRALPKDYIVLLVLAVMLGVLVTISIGFLLAGGVSFYLYQANYPLSTIILYAAIVWVVYILLLACFLYYKKNRVKQKQAHLLHIVQNELMATLALRSLNIALRKWQRKHDHP